MRFRLTIRDDKNGVELRGYANSQTVGILSQALSEKGSPAMIAASPVGEDYDPFTKPPVEAVAARIREGYLDWYRAEYGPGHPGSSRSTPWDELPWQRQQKWIEAAKAVMD